MTEVDADVAGEDAFRIPSLWQLGERARTGNVEARLQILVAGAALTAGEYRLDRWYVAYMDLQQEQADRRCEYRRRLVKTSTDDGLFEAWALANHLADTEFYSEIDHAIRSWEERIAMTEEDFMPTASATRLPQPTSFKKVAGVRHWLCPACEVERWNPDQYRACQYCSTRVFLPDAGDVPETQAAAAAKEAAADLMPGIELDKDGAVIHGQRSFKLRISAAIADAVFEHVEAPLHLVDDNPDNTRQNFDDVSLAETAESMMLVGQIQACLARRNGERYQLIDGGRRRRAAVIAGRTTLRLDLVPDSIDDATALEMMGRANEERKEFDPISRALWFEKLLKARGCTQQELGDRLRVSQGVISNHLRLLDLPDCWRKRLIAREITETHARPLLPWTKYPELLERIDKTLAKEKEIPSAREWSRWLANELHSQTRPGRPGEYVSLSGYYGPNLLTAADYKTHRDELQIVEVPQQYGSGTEPRVLNVKLWQKLHGPLVKKQTEERQARQAAVSTSKGKTLAKGSKEPTGPKPDQIEDDIESWTSRQIGLRVEKDATDQDVVAVAVLVGTCGSEALDETAARATLGMKKKVGFSDRSLELWTLLGKADPKKRMASLRAAVAALFTNTRFGLVLECAETVAALAAHLGIQYSRDWRPTAEVLERYPVTTLRELPAAKRCLAAAKLDKPALVKSLLKHWQPGEFPPGYEPKATPKKAGKR